MVMAMAIIGFVFGAVLVVTVALFAVLSMEGGFRENLEATARLALRRLTGRAPKITAASPAGRAMELEGRLRTMAEEAKVLQKLIEQTRGERDALKLELQKAARDREEAANAAQARDARIAELMATLQAESGRVIQLREEAGGLQAQIADLKTQVRDLETELNVAQSGVDLTGVPR